MMNSSTPIGCRMCFEKFNFNNLSKMLLLCKNCENTQISQTFKQCEYCRSDFKSSIEGQICQKCKIQLNKHGEPSSCTICNLKMAYGNEVICIRCSHYRSKFGDPKQCANCCQYCAFFKDESSRKKVDGKLLCWLCTYFYKLQKAKALKASKRRVDVTVITSDNNSTRNLSSTEPFNKKVRVEEDSLPNYSNDAAYNEQLLKVSSLQDEVKDLRRKVVAKENELLARDNLIAGLKADLIQREQDATTREIVLKSRWQKEKENLHDKIKQLQRENSGLMKGGKKRRPVISGMDYLTKDPLTRPPSYANSPKNTNSPKVEAKVNDFKNLTVDEDETIAETNENSDVKQTDQMPEIKAEDVKNDKEEEAVNKNENSEVSPNEGFENDGTSNLSLGSSSKNSSHEASPAT